MRAADARSGTSTVDGRRLDEVVVGRHRVSGASSLPRVVSRKLAGAGRPRLGFALLAFGTAGAALALAGAHTYALLAIAPLCWAGAALLLVGRGSLPLPLPSRVAFALAVYTLVQAGPIPVWLLGVLSPNAADVWARALHPFGEALSVGALSLDPGASLRESLKWATYGVSFGGAALVCERYGRHACVLVVFLSALLIAIVTLAHGLLGATRVFGIYEPSFEPSRWRIGPFLNPNTLSGYLNLGIFSGLGLVYSRRMENGRWLVVIGVAVLFGVSVLTGSRGGVWLMPLGLVAFFVLTLTSHRWHHQRRPSWQRRSALWLAIGLGVVFVGAGATQLTWAELQQQNVEKLFLAKDVLPMVADHPLFGVGRGAFETAFAAYAPASANSIYAHPENFVLQWLSEWGVPFGVVALAAFAWAFRPARVDVLSSGTGIGAAVAVGLLLLQNLIDLGSELPAVGLAVVWLLASIWRREARQPPSGRGSQAPYRRAVLLVAPGILLWVLSAVDAPTDARAERREIHRAYQALDSGKASEVSKLRSELHAVMSRLPADPYFARIGAVVARRAGDSDPMPWIQRALERGLNQARTHLVLAQVLHDRGASLQALFELRRTAELDAALTSEVGDLAAAWASEIDELERAAPADARGSAVLVAAARRIPRADLRERALRAALQRDRASTSALRELARLLQRNLETGECPSSNPCADEALAAARAWSTAEPSAAEPLECEAHVLRKLGRPAEAALTLERRCPSLVEREHVRCLLARLDLARRLPDPDRGELSQLATTTAREACRQLPNCANTLLSIGDTLREANLLPEALLTYEQAVQQQPTAGALLRVAEVAVSLGRYSKAESTLTRAAGLIPRDTDDGRLIQQRREALRREILLRTIAPRP
jgi:tetratricopeptide (TPR) repeat protein